MGKHALLATDFREIMGIDNFESDEISEIQLKFEIISCLVEWATLISRLIPLHFYLYDRSLQCFLKKKTRTHQRPSG
jgi:hypothetical protein